MKFRNSGRHAIHGAVTRDLAQRNGRVSPLNELSLAVASSRLPLTVTRLPARPRTAESQP